MVPISVDLLSAPCRQCILQWTPVVQERVLYLSSLDSLVRGSFQCDSENPCLLRLSTTTCNKIKVMTKLIPMYTSRCNGSGVSVENAVP